MEQERIFALCQNVEEIKQSVLIQVGGEESKWYKYVHKKYTQYAQNRQLFVAKYRNNMEKVIGFLLYKSDSFKLGYFYLEQINVSKEFRRRGVASFMVKEFFEFCKGVELENPFGDDEEGKGFTLLKGVFSMVQKENLISQALHLKNGFQPCGTILIGYDDLRIWYKRDITR